MNVLFVCLGNICRSPIAAELLRSKYREQNINAQVDSAGFEAFYINESPNAAAIKEGQKRGLNISDHQARLFNSNDFDKFDKIYVMDTKNMRDVKYFSRNDADLDKIDFIMNLIEPGKNKNILDPFSRDLGKEDELFKLMEIACNKIVDEAKSKLQIH